MFRIRVYGEDNITRMARAVAEGPDHLRANYARSMRSASQTTLRAAKRAAATVPIRGFRKGGRPYRGPSAPKGLRARMAAAVDLDLNVGSLSPRAQFVVHTARIGAGRVPEYIEAGIVWRHPIMGNRHGWAAEQGKKWFEPAIEHSRPLYERRINEAVDRTARAISR